MNGPNLVRDQRRSPVAAPCRLSNENSPAKFQNVSGSSARQIDFSVGTGERPRCNFVHGFDRYSAVKKAKSLCRRNWGPSHQQDHLFSDQMLTRFREAIGAESGRFLNVRSAAVRRRDTVANQLFTTGSGTETRRCKLLIWCAQHDSNVRPPGS